MATPTTNQKSASVKYKFGDDELDLNDYIRNLNHNYQSYVNSQNWNEGQRQEFRSAYDNFLKGLQDQLANNTNRFSTDFSGSIIDSTGQLSNTDNDDIDPVGSEYYYNDKGDRITTDDLNTMGKRQQKKYSTFSANRQVATFFNKVGTALRDARKNKPTTQNQSNAFNLSKHGFLANWTTANNPAGGEFNLSPYLEKDTLDETTGLRGTTNRAAYLKEQIENYLNNVGNYDFSGTPFKDRETYISKLRAAAQNLENGYNSEDVIALNQAGIGNEFLSKFFATGAEQKKTEVQQAAEDLMKIQQQQQAQKIIDRRNQLQYEADRDKFFSQYQASNPFQSREPSIPLPLSYTRQAVEEAAIKKFNADPNNKEDVREAIRQYINIPQLSKFIRGKSNLILQDGTDITAQHITNNLDLAAQADLFINPMYLDEQGKSILPNGYYVLPGSEDYDNWTYIAYNPNTRQYQEQSMLLNDELKKRMAYSEYDKRNKKSNEAQKHQLGGTFKDMESRRNKAQEEKQKVEQKSYATGRTKEQIESDQAPHTEWSKADLLRLGAIGGDVASLIASMTGVGSVASAGIGMTSTAANQAADMAEGMGFLESLGNNAVSYGLDALSLIPFARAAKIPKTIKAIAGFAPKLMAIISTAQGISNAPEITKSLSKLNSSESLTVEDWRNIANGIQIVLGGTAATHRASKAKSHVDAARTNDEWLKTEQGYRRISEQDMKKLREAATIKEQNTILSPYNVTLAESRKRFGLGKGKGKADITSENYYYDFDKPVTTYSGDLPIQHTFGPGEKWLGTRNIPSLRIPAVRDAYNRVIHPQAYNRAKGKATEGNKQRSTFDISKLRELSSQTGKLTSQEIATINRQRVKSGKGKLTEQEIQTLNQRRQNRASDGTDNSFQARLQRYKDAKREGKFTSVEDGGTLDLVRVRKFQNAGKFPEWYSKLYKFQNLTGWNNSLNQSLAGPSITNENVGHYRAGDLNEAYTKNNSYTSNPNLVGQDLQSYYDSSFKGKSLDDYVSAYNANAAKIRGYWDQERTYKQSGAQEHNRLFKNMFGNRSDNSNNVWNIGYDSNLEDIVGSSTWLRRMDRYEKEFDNLSDEEKKSRIHKIDLGDGNFGYVYKKANGDIAVWNQPETPATSAIQPSQEPSDDNKQNKSFFSNINPTIAYGLPRAVYADRMNRRITDLAKESVVPLLKDPFEVHRYTRSDLDAEMQGERNYANLRRLASRPITSDGSLQTATQLQAEVQGQEARTAGKEKSNQVQRQYDELAWQQEKENAANRHETAMFNRAQQWGADQDKSKYEQAYLAKKFNIWDVVGQQLEYDERVKQQENKALTDNFARSDIHNAVNYAPNEYGAGLSAEELSVWNKVLSGTNPSSLQPNEFNQYRLAMQKVSRVENEQLRQHYNIPNTRWSGKSMQSIPEQISIIKKGGVVSAKNGSKIAVAGIEAKTADAERFQKQIKETIDRNEKAIDRLSKSLYGIIKASMIK